jgi:hypothetical protein
VGAWSMSLPVSPDLRPHQQGPSPEGTLTAGPGRGSLSEVQWILLESLEPCQLPCSSYPFCSLNLDGGGD